MIDKIRSVDFPKNQNVKAILHSGSAKIQNENKRNGENKNLISPKKAFGDLTKKLENLKKIVKTHFKYEILKNPDMIVLKIIDESNGEVVRQIPPEEAVRLAKAIDDLLGLFVDKHV